ncbi:MAG TPA: hypothetical protein VI248_14450 [Kineosporiaceae bacterium]
MSLPQQAWVTVTVWVPAPIRLALLLALGLLAALRLVPALLRVVGRCLQRSESTLALLTYPEFLATSFARQLGRPLLPGTFAYGQLLGVAHTGLVATGRLLDRAGSHRARLRGWLFAGPTVLLLGIWYGGTDLPSGVVGDAVRTARIGLITTDAWLMDGRTAPPPDTCPAAPDRSRRTAPSSVPARSAPPRRAPQGGSRKSTVQRPTQGR